MTPETKVLKEVILPRRPPKNGEVSLSEGGDCGACVLAGLLGLPDAEDAYKLHCPGTYYGGEPIPKVHHFTRQSMVNTLGSLQSDSGSRGGMDGVPVLLDHVIDSIPIWPFDQHEGQLAFGLRAQFEWRSHARAMFNGDYYGVTQVKHGGYDPESPVRAHGATDHWVLLCGWRYLYSLEGESEERRAAGLGHYDEQILVSDSSKARPLETWVDLNDFQRYWGGFAAIWVRLLP